MKTGCPYSVFLISCLLSFVCRAEKATEFSTIEVNARQGKKTSITLLVPKKTDLDKFMRSRAQRRINMQLSPEDNDRMEDMTQLAYQEEFEEFWLEKKPVL